MVTREGSRSASAEQRLKEIGIKLPAPPEPFGAYAEAVQTDNLLFLSGMLPTEGRAAKFIGRVGAEIDVEAGCKAARLAALNVLAVARQHLGSLDKVTRIVRLGVSVATSGECPRTAESRRRRLGVAARRLRKRQGPLPPGVWRRKPSARHPGRAGNHFRGGGQVMLASFQLLAQAQGKDSPVEHPTSYRTAQTDGLHLLQRSRPERRASRRRRMSFDIERQSHDIRPARRRKNMSRSSPFPANRRSDR